ncbi:MAG: hypothetical protein ABIK08_04570 [Pseudomonadota bacterium]
MRVRDVVNLTMKELVAEHNTLAKAAGVPEVKRFATRPAAEARLLRLRAEAKPKAPKVRVPRTTEPRAAPVKATLNKSPYVNQSPLNCGT